MMLLLPLILLVHLVPFLRNILLLLPDSLELKFLLLVPLLEELMVIMILLALRRDSVRMIILCLMMIYAGSLMNVLDDDLCRDLRVTPLKGTQRFSIKGKLAPRYIGAF